MTDAAASQAPIIIAFVSGKGGCGKTTLALNFANVVAATGQQVLIVDADLANHGSSGALSDVVRDAREPLTTSSVLSSSRGAEAALAREPVRIKNTILFLPAVVAGESVSSLEGRTAEDTSTSLRESLTRIAEARGVRCIVLDCFCGIDLLTTASVGAADEAIIVNEPDLITFGGSLHLIRHLERELSGWARRPALHVVINRMRPPHTVRSLAYLYRGNLDKQISESILCHVPYNDKIFRNFGQHPFASDLIPQSLFVKKLQLLAYGLFYGRRNDLVPLPARKWSSRKIRSLYMRSIDPSAVDAEYLALKLSAFPVLAGVWLIGFVLTFNATRLSPGEAWGATVMAFCSAVFILGGSLLHGFWLSARLNFTVSGLRWRLASLASKLRRFRLAAGALGSGLVGSLMSVVVASGVLSLGIGTALFLDWALNVGYATDGEPNLTNRMVHVAMQMPVRQLDLSGQTVEDYKAFYPLGKMTSPGPHTTTLEKATLVGDGTKFVRSTIPAGALSNVRLDHVTFESCIFTSLFEIEGPPLGTLDEGSAPNDGTGRQGPTLRIEKSRLSRVVIADPRTEGGVPLKRIVLTGKSRLESVRFELREGTELVVENAEIVGHLEVDNLDGVQGIGVRVVTTEGPRVRTTGNVAIERPTSSAKEHVLRTRIENTEFVVKQLRAGDQGEKASLGRELADLTELYVLRASREDYDRARGTLEELGEIQGFEGYARLLAVLLHIRQLDESGDKRTPRALRNAARAWVESLRDGELGPDWGWDWRLWDEHAKLSPRGETLVRLLRASIPVPDFLFDVGRQQGPAGANQLAPGEFLDAFERTLRGDEGGDAEAKRYVQIGSSGSREVLLEWARQLSELAYSVEAYESGVEDGGLYVLTLGEHPAAEAEALKREWEADPKHTRAFLTIGETYRRRIY